MRKLLLATLLLLLFQACKQDNEASTQGQVENGLLFTFQGMPRTVALNGKAKELTAEWKEFKELQRGIDVMYNSVSNADLTLAINDLLEKEKKLGEAEIPEVYDHNKVKSRLKVLRTFILKTEAQLASNRDATSAIKEMLEANNALRNQLNLMVNNPVNLDSIFNEN